MTPTPASISTGQSLAPCLLLSFLFSPSFSTLYFLRQETPWLKLRPCCPLVLDHRSANLPQPPSRSGTGAPSPPPPRSCREWNPGDRIRPPRRLRPSDPLALGSSLPPRPRSSRKPRHGCIKFGHGVLPQVNFSGATGPSRSSSMAALTSCTLAPSPSIAESRCAPPVSSGSATSVALWTLASTACKSRRPPRLPVATPVRFPDTDKKGPGSKIEIFPRPCKPDSEGNSLPDNPFEEEFGSSSDSGQGVWTELSEQVASNLADTVVSLASFADEKTVFFACTGIIIVNNPTITSFLTSLSLVRSIDDDTKILHDMKIEVRLPDNQLKPGWLEFYDLKYNVAVINIFRCHSLQVARLDHQRQFESHSKVVAVGRCFKSGKLMATTGMLTDNPKGAYREELAISTCEITMTGVGGPLIDFNGDFIGMNFYAEKETPFLPRNKILELLSQFSKITLSWATSKKGPDIKIERFPRPKSDSKVRSRKGEKLKDQKPSVCTLCDPECQPGLMDRLLLERKSLCSGRPSYPYSGVSTKKELRSNGYPLPVWNDGGNRLLNNFEEKFSEDIWSELERNVASNMSQSVVALASFSGKTRCFACTGVFIDCNGSTTRVLTSASLVRTSDNENKVADNLKIVVCLPDNRHTRGTLQHYNLHYNIAVVHIKDFCCTQTAQIDNQMLIKPQKEVVAIGRIYQSGELMATGGIVIDKSSKLDCKELKISTCKITKAGIGGPLIDFDGNFIGMNFYGLEETPYIPVNIILEVWKNFDAQGTVARDDDDSPNRWPVPRPFWCYPMWHEIEEEVDLEEEIKNQRRQLY